MSETSSPVVSASLSGVSASSATSQLAIPLDDCFASTPQFRKRLENSESSIQALESSIKTLQKFTSQAIEHERGFSQKNVQIADELQNLGNQLLGADEAPTLTQSSLARFSEVLREIERSRSILMTHIQEVFLHPLDKFVKNDVASCRKSQKTYEQASDAYENALGKYMNKRAKDSGINESAEEAAALRKELHRHTIAYSMNLNDLQIRKKFEVVETIVAMIYTQYAFYHQSYEMLKDLEPSLRQVSGYISTIRNAYTKAPKPDGDAYLQFTLPEQYNPLSARSPPSPTTGKKAGYLYKRGSTKMRNFWQRRYFEIEGDMMWYHSQKDNAKDKDEELATGRTEIDLRVCMVREVKDTERRFCFEIVSPNRTYTLQAESEVEMQEWINLIQNGINQALKYVPTSPRISAQPTSAEGKLETGSRRDLKASSNHDVHHTNAEILHILRQVPGNNVCCDCGAPDPDWASCNLGSLLCITCSGIHRGLGRQVSKVRSISLDKWEPECVEVMKSLGNKTVNGIFEASLARHTQADSIRPPLNASRSDRERWINSKYVSKEFVWSEQNTKDVVESSVDMCLFNAIDDGDLPRALKFLALGANINYQRPGGNYTPLIQAAINGNSVVVEFLLQWMCDTSLSDINGSTALHHAVKSKSPAIAGMLVRRGVDCDAHDHEGRTPLDIAVHLSDADEGYAKLVTLLRLAVFNNDNNKTMSWRPGAYGITEALKSLSIDPNNSPISKSVRVGPPPSSLSSQDLGAGVPAFTLQSEPVNTTMVPDATQRTVPTFSGDVVLNNPWSDNHVDEFEPSPVVAPSPTKLMDMLSRSDQFNQTSS